MNILSQTKAYNVRTAIVITAIKIAGSFLLLATGATMLGGLFAPASDVEKPLNAPSYDSAVHREAASLVCQVETGQHGLVRANSSVVAGHVMVVRLDGVMQRMDTTEAWDRTESKNQDDDVWVVGVCKADVR